MGDAIRHRGAAPSSDRTHRTDGTYASRPKSALTPARAQPYAAIAPHSDLRVVARCGTRLALVGAALSAKAPMAPADAGQHPGKTGGFLVVVDVFSSD